LATATFAQPDEIDRCSFDEWLAEIEITQPGYRQELEQSFKNFKQAEKSSSRATITIPIHVIVVHPSGQPVGTGSNHSLARIQSQIDVLNQDFGRYNSDAGNTPPEFPAADTGIQFCLATVDPDGNPTDGVTRYAFDGSFQGNAFAIRQQTSWPREFYCNIWSAPNLSYLGLASVPSTFNLPSPGNDFIHVDAATFGGPGFATFPNYNLGRTTTHEMGHWLGLFHVWGNGGCTSDDGIADTPIQNDSNFGCPNHPSSSCGNTGDMFMNYMDYVNDNCMNAFTQGQAQYMQTILSTSRASLSGSAFTACATSVPLTINISSQGDPTCFDSEDGFIFVEASGGSPDYSFSINGSAPTPNNLFIDLPGGDYIIEVFDLDGNAASAATFLNTPLPLDFSINETQTNTCPADTNASIEVIVSGGSNPYTFSINSDSEQSSNIFEGLANGSYTMQVTDNNGCTYEDVFELSGDAEISIHIDSTANLICSNDDMGFISASATGGAGPLSYSINGFDFQASGTFTMLDGGSYFVYVQDSVGCYDSLEVTLSEPDPFFLSLVSEDASCFGFNDGNVNVMAFGGNGGPFQYSFDSLTFGDATTLDSLSAGEYDLYALDSLGCLATATFSIGEPDAVEIEILLAQSVDCFGDTNGQVDFMASGGNGDFIYILEGDTSLTPSFKNLGAGAYTLFAIDSIGCMGSTFFEIGINSTISVSVILADNPSCFGESDGSITVESTNTQGSVTYTVNGGTPQSEPFFEGLTAGNYEIVVADKSECNAVLQVTLDQPTELSAQAINIMEVSCHGAEDGSADIQIVGGTLPYTVSYASPDIDLTNLAAGLYTVTVEDMNLCATTATFEITQPSPLSLQTDNINGANCQTGQGAIIEFIVSGGTEGYIFSLSGPSGNLTNTTGLFEELVFGPHSLTVTDSRVCVLSEDVVVPYSNDFYAEIISVSPILCFGELGGALEIEVQGGVGNIIYLLDGDQPVDPIDLNTGAGEYSISIIDEEDCLIELFFTLEEPEELIVEEMVLDFASEPWTITVITVGGTEPYAYSFDEGETFTDSNVLEIFENGTYTVIVRDANGCEAESITFLDNVNEIATDWTINAYPNPTVDELTISLDLPKTTEATIQVFDLSGQLVNNIPAKKYNSGENFVKIDLGNFASSIYILKIASAEGYRYIKATKL